MATGGPGAFWGEAGSACGSDNTAAPTCDGITCSGHGTCDDSGGAIVCSCDTGGCCHDLDGDGDVDNAFGNLVAQLASMGVDANQILADEIQADNLCRLFEFADIDDLQTDAELGLVWTGCTDPDGSFGDNLTGEESFTVGEEWFVQLPSGGCSADWLAPFDDSAVADFAMGAGAAELPGFPLPLPLGEGLPMASISLVGVVADAWLEDDGFGPQAVSGEMSGIILMADWYGALNDFANANCACLNLTEDLYEVTFSGGYDVTCHTSSNSNCGGAGLEPTCQALNDYCAIKTMLFNPDQDSDGDSVPDGMSVGMYFETVSATISGITP